jgi:hypothetical protein
MKCLFCCILTKKEYNNQKKEGKADEQIVVTEPHDATTWQPIPFADGFSHVIPVCLMHLVSPKSSVLA